MSYQVIARKWRPQTFEEVTGQEAITRTLRNAIEHDRLHHAYLFSGARGVGKTTTARLLAKALNCHKTGKPNPNPCPAGDDGACVSCREIAESRSIDVLEFDAASHTKVEEIRDIILESINVNPARDRYKIFIIDEVHMLSTSSFNALLKTLEEPPPNVAFIMATTEPHKIPDTILSRCQEFEFRTIPLGKILARLKEIAKAEGVRISDEALREIARSGEGSMRDAQSNFDQVISFSGDEIDVPDVTKALGIASSDTLTRVVEAVASNRPADALQVVDDLISRGHDLRNYLRDLMGLVRDLLVLKTAGDAEGLLETAAIDVETLRGYSDGFSVSDLVRFFNSLAATETDVRDAAQPRHVLEIGLVKLVEMRRLASLDDVIERLTRLESVEAADERTRPEPTEEKKTLKNGPGAQGSPERAPEPKIDPREAPPSAESEATAEGWMPSDETTGAQSGVWTEVADAEPDRTDARSKIDALKEEILRNVALRLPPMSAEDLAHADDTWLDAAYEAKLLRSGDDLMPIRGASELASALVGSRSAESGSVPTEQVQVPRPKRPPVVVTEESAGDEPADLPELPDNPTREELMAYAGSHPVVKRVLKTFRAQITDVKKIR